MKKLWKLPLLLALLAISTPLCAASEGSTTYIMAVGSDRSFDASLKGLKYSTVDSQRFARAMELVAQVPINQIKIINNTSLEDFRKSASESLLYLQKSQQIKRFVLFFSGHSDERGLHFRNGLLSKEELHSFLKKVPAPTKVSILDSCYSGALAAKGIEPGVEEFVIPRTDFDEPTGTVFLTAASADEGAFESTRLEGSVFSNYLVAGLYGSADANGDGLVTVEELYQFIYQKTRYDNLILPHRIQQQPEFVSNLSGRGALVLSMPKTNLQSLRLDPRIMGDVKLYATYGLKSFTVSTGDNPSKTIQLPAGDYNMSVQNGNRVGRTTVRIEREKVAAVNYDSLEWQTISSITTASKGFDESFFKFGAEVGVHGGHLVQESPGPEGEVSVSAGRYFFLSTTFRPFVALQARQNKLEIEGMKANVSSASVLGGVKGSVSPGIPNVEMYGLVAGGMGREEQRWHYEDREDKRATSHPVGQVGVGSSYGLESGLRLGLEYRREAIRIRDEEFGEQTLSGNIFGASVTY